MIYPIVKFGNPVLEKRAEPVTVFDDQLQKLVEDMFESMYEAHGVGLAAPQIGISKQLAVIDVTFKEDPDAKLVLANPEILHTEGKHSQPEGCLSIPEFREPVTRARTVTIRAQDVHGKWYEKTTQEGEELLARAFLHETEHLHGKLYISHLSALKRDLMKRKIRKLMKAGEW
jgi:peptide deformylase